MRKFASIATATALAASLLVGGTAAEATVSSIVGGGSSFAGGVLSVCRVDFNAVTSSTVNSQHVDIATYSTTGGSGTGRTNFASNTYDYGATDAPYSSGAPNDTVYVPLVGGPIAIVYNNSDFSGNSLKLNATVVSRIFQGNITYWDNSQIKALNPGKTIGHNRIGVTFRSGSSGTTENFVNWIKANSSSDSGNWTKSGDWSAATEGSVVGTSKSSSAVLANDVDATAYTIGYVDLKDAVTQTAQFAMVKNGKGQYVLPSVSSASKFLARQTPSSSGLVNFKYLSGAKSGEYNLSLITYGLGHKYKARYVRSSTAAADTLKTSRAVRDFFKYTISTCGAAKAPGLKYVNLTGALKTKALAQAALIGSK
jgi:phosphate transport system substrate-binding protein